MKYLEFDGKASEAFFILLGAFLITLFTAGLAMPWATTMRQRWIAKHTTIEGKRLVFKGDGSALFGKYILWMLFTLLTAGLYGFVAYARYQKWIVENTAIQE